MAAHGARRLLDMAGNAAMVLAIEALAAAQGLEFHEGLRSSAALEKARAAIRGVVPALDDDRYFHPDIEAAAALVLSGGLADAAGIELPGL